MKIAAVLSILTLAGCAPPHVPTADEAKAAIWADVNLNAWIGNGNDQLSADWVIGHDVYGHTPTLRISALTCGSTGFVHRCRFDIIREPDPAASAEDKAEPRHLSCSAELVTAKENGAETWQVDHKPPLPTGGHSRTTMECAIVQG